MADSSIDAAKANAAQRAVADHFHPDAAYVGIGSGTTIVHVVEAIKARSTNQDIQFIPTGTQSKGVVENAGLTPTTLDQVPEGTLLDVAFDGADEVDDELNCIKGGGAALFQEKLVVERAKKFVCVADYRKAQARLLTAWPTIPIEVAPIATRSVLTALRALGSSDPKIRQSSGSPLRTDQDFFIIDAPFPTLLTAGDVTSGAGAEQAPEGKRWQVEDLAARIKEITGVLEVGLFSGPDGPNAMEVLGRGGQKPVAVYFGMQDGSVEVRTAK